MGIINYNRHRKAIEQMYEDTCMISRYYDEGKDPVTKETKLTLKAVYADKKCKLSQIMLPKDGQTEAQNDIRYDAKLFIAPDIEILQGDVVSVNRPAGKVTTFTAGEPYVYSSHQEVALSREGWA